MKELILNFVNKHKKYVIIGCSILVVLILGLLSWKLVFVKFKEFHRNESKFLEATKRYYEYHKQYLPKDNEARTLTLQDLYDNNQLGDLYIPSTKKLCDVNSWVRVYKEDNEYKYVTYLKCGRYVSKGDHEGPVITLKGDLEVSIPLNSEYQELGVKEVVDNKDGRITRDNVVIDSSKVNTSKIGTYDVTYTVVDSKYNKTEVIRKVIVNKGLSETVKNSTNVDGYYKGNSNNYVLFSGMMWRIINVDSDGNVKIILNQPITNLRMNHKTYKNSNVDTWLNNIFYKALKNNGSSKYIQKSKYCVGNINSMIDFNDYCSDGIEEKVALLDVDTYYKTFNGEESSIYSKSFALSNMIGSNYADATFNDTKPDGTNSSILAPIRPVITLKNSLNIISGNGTVTKPYKLNDYNYAMKTSKINTRLVGEYIEYSGLKFRIIDIDKNDNVRLIMDSVLNVQPNVTPLYVSTEKLSKWSFDLTDEDNPAYVVNNDYLDYLNTKYLVDTEYEIPVNDSNLKYNEYKKNKIKAKVVFPKTYELFAAADNVQNMYLYIDSSVNDQLLFTANSSTSQVFEINKTDFVTFAVKGIITLKGDLKIASGKGTYNNPYKLK